MKALIIGSNGYIGRHLVRILQENGIPLSCCDKHDYSLDKVDNYQKIDIRNRDQINDLDFGVDYIFVFAGLSGTTASFRNYKNFIDVNEKGLLNILDGIRSQNVFPRIVFPSTRLVYKGSNLPLSEESTLELKTIYASNKFACENYLKLYNEYYGIAYTIFRICVPYGNLLDGQYSYGTTGFFITQAINNKAISLFGDGSQRRTFTHVYDIVCIMVQTLQQTASKNETFNIGGEDFSLYEVANLIANKYHAEVTAKPWPEMDLKLESGSTVFDSSKIDDLLNYKYKYCLEKWVEQL
jgi:UDP-glucose 4-epimerase